MIRFEEALEARNFTPAGRREWLGDISVPDATGTVSPMRHRVVITDDFPFLPPKVAPEPRLPGPLWHMEHNGFLCLYSRDSRRQRPWEDVDALIERVISWHTATAAGWPNEPGDLDLERYFEKHERTLIVFDDLESLLGLSLKLRNIGNDAYLAEARGPLRARTHSQAKRERRGRPPGEVWSACVDLGVLDQPVNSWRGIASRLPQPMRGQLWALVRTGRRGVVLMKYGRHTVNGVSTGVAAIAVNMARRAPDADPAIAALRVEDRRAAWTNRAGPDANRLGTRRVAVVGCGAVGSFLVEQLVRAGVRELTLVDPDTLRHGNCVRHLAPPAYLNWLKVDAVSTIVTDRFDLPRGAVTAMADSLNPDLAFELFRSHHLIIDAAADGAVTAILENLADLLGETWVKVGIHRNGGVIRADRLGHGTLLWSHRPAPVPAFDAASGVRETGCGDPVSPTPPSAVAAAAVLACRLSVDTLRSKRQRLLPDCIVEVLTPQGPSGGPYGNVQTVIP